MSPKNLAKPRGRIERRGGSLVQLIEVVQQSLAPLMPRGETAAK
jgi:hypothetical protein